MLQEILDSCNGMIQLYSRAADRELQIDLKNNEVLNKNGLKNPYFTKNLKKWGKIQTEHPILTATYSVLYYSTHLPTASKNSKYIWKLLKSK